MRLFPRPTTFGVATLLAVTLVTASGCEPGGRPVLEPGSAQVTPSQPAQPTKPTKPTQSTKPAQPTKPVKATGNLSLSGRFIVDAEGKQFIPRGPELVTASIDQLSEIDAIAATGANAMRMLLTLDTANQMTPEKFDRLVGHAVSKDMVVWVSLFTWDNANNRAVAPALGGGQLRKMDDYLTIWQRQWLKDLIKKYDGAVVIDAMQEFVNTIKPPESAGAVKEWVEAAKKHVRFFRQQGYTQPLEIMSSFEGRDLHAIVANADEILAADTLTSNGTKQTLFGWQAYWGTDFYRGWQGQEFNIGGPLTAAEAIKRFVATRNYPIMVGLDTTDIPGTESYGTLMPTCAKETVGWLWWEWTELTTASHGATVRNSKDGFAGAVKPALKVKAKA
jgi:hypothetical protein